MMTYSDDDVDGLVIGFLLFTEGPFGVDDTSCGTVYRKRKEEEEKEKESTKTRGNVDSEVNGHGRTDMIGGY